MNIVYEGNTVEGILEGFRRGPGGGRGCWLWVALEGGSVSFP